MTLDRDLIPRMTMLYVEAAPANTEELLRYPRLRRYVATWWEHEENGVAVFDGEVRSVGMGHPGAWKEWVSGMMEKLLTASELLTGVAVVRVGLARPAESVLIVDTLKRQVWLAGKPDGERYVKAQPGAVTRTNGGVGQRRKRHYG